jgi:LCP family protein required for cell wall assembly
VPKRSIAIAGAVVATLVVGLVGSLLLFGGSGGDTTTTTVAAATTTTTTTTQPTTTTTAPTTTAVVEEVVPDSTRPEVEITLRFESSGQLQLAARDFYAWLGDPANNEPPPMTEGVSDYAAGAVPDEDLSLQGSFSVGPIDPETRTAVVTVDDDVLLAVDEGDGWRFVGAKLARFGLEAYYGEPVRHVMIIGTDARRGQDQRVFRGDSLHVVSSAIGEQGGSIVGFPRDSYVDAPYGGKDKFTHINALAGPEDVVQVARDLTGLPIEGYIVTGFLGFERMVNDFGGVEVNVPFAMADPKSKAYLNAGPQVLWGANALAFSRNRSITGSDFTRSFHHGLVMIGALNGVQNRGIIELPQLLSILVTYTWTDLAIEDLLTMAAGAFEIDPDTVVNLVLPGTITTAGGASVVMLDEEETEAVYRDLEDGIVAAPEE